ncbi:MAG: hypothetical protein ACTIJ4_16605, partial [Halomonas sp.]|uniref:hypothetical protein n=1 Tax=Halomonas sp. TaxID=1486246 RepID=UPI003F9D5A96
KVACGGVALKYTVDVFTQALKHKKSLGATTNFRGYCDVGASADDFKLRRLALTPWIAGGFVGSR